MIGDRRRVIAEAESWLGTPYHHMGRLKGVGCDCLTLLAGVYHASGVIPALDIPFYPPDWHLHRSVERYLEGLVGHACEVDGAKPGDVARVQIRPLFFARRHRYRLAASDPRLACWRGHPRGCHPTIARAPPGAVLLAVLRQ